MQRIILKYKCSAVQNGGAREDFTKLGSGGVVRQ